MTDDSKSFEKKLDRDFLFYLNLTKNLFQNVKDDEKQFCEVWLTHLLGKNISSLAEKCDRNIYLSRLLLQMQNSKLTEVFLETPPSGTLPCAFETFNFPTEVEGLKGFEELGFQVDSSIGGGSGDFFETSRDGRTYLATRRLPEGVMAYIAVTNNEGEPVWMPQRCPTRPGTSQSRPGTSGRTSEGFTKKLLDCIPTPLSQIRKSPEEREKVLEWMDKIIDDCNKWLTGEDPHNSELEELFKMVYEEYQKDPEKCLILKKSGSVRSILIKDIRDQIAARRAEISKRELILDQYESEEFSEERASEDYLDSVWLECAKKPMSESVRNALEAVYPPELIQRFTEYLYQERLLIIEKGEKQAKKRISELRKSSIDDTVKELQKLKKAKEEYKEYYSIYKDIEQKATEFEKEWNEKCAKSEKSDQENLEKYKQEMEAEVQLAKRNFDRERRYQHELEEQLEVAKEAYRKMEMGKAMEAEKLSCEDNQVLLRKEELEQQICALTQKKEELKRQELRAKLRSRRSKFAKAYEETSGLTSAPMYSKRTIKKSTGNGSGFNSLRFMPDFASKERFRKPGTNRKLAISEHQKYRKSPTYYTKKTRWWHHFN